MKNKIEKEIELKAPLKKVWKAITNHKEFGEWFRVKLNGPFKQGEKVSGFITYPGYEHFKWEADVKEITPEQVFSFTWVPYAIDPKVDYTQEVPTLVEFRLKPLSYGTLLTVSESGFENTPAHRRDEAYAMNEKGWTQQMKNIEEYLKRLV